MYMCVCVYSHTLFIIYHIFIVKFAQVSITNLIFFLIQPDLEGKEKVFDLKCLLRILIDTKGISKPS